MPAGRSPASSGRRRSRKKGPPTPSPPLPAQDSNPLPPGTEIEVRIDDEGFYGSWYEATVVGFDPAAGRSPAKYTVTYAHLEAQDGPESVDPSHVRPRPPPPSSRGSPSSTPAPPPRFLLHDFVEAFDDNGWLSGIVVAPMPADPSSPVTVAFPITREVLPFPPHLVRPRRDYVGGGWVPSQAVIAVKPRRPVRVYKAGEKVELLRERGAYGDCSWFPATVAKVVDRLSYVVEFLDDQVGGGKAAVYRHWGYIRPAEYHRPRGSKVRLCPGAVVEVYCDGAWSQGVVRRVVREGCEYEVSVHDEEAEQLLTKAVHQLRPLYIWNGKHWTNPGDKIHVNLRQQPASGKCPSSLVDATSSDDEHSGIPESPTAKKSRGETHLKAQAHQGKIDAFGHVQIQLEEKKNSSGKEIVCDLSDSAVCQKTSAWTRQVSGGTSSGSDSEGVNFDKLATKECPGLLDKELSRTINRVCQANRNADVCTDTAATQVTESNPLTEIPILSLDHVVQQDGSKVDERSNMLHSQNAKSSEFTTDSIQLRTCSFSGSYVPSHMSFSQISDYQVPFVKSSPVWPLIDALDVFKKVSQQPHFRPLTKLLPSLREGTAIGLMATFASTVEDISKLSIADSIASFEEKITTLRHLEEHGFDVQFLRCSLVKLIQVKSNHTSYLTEKDQLKAQLLEKSACLSQIDERLDNEKQTMARLEEELGRARCEAQKIAEEKEREDGELLILNAAKRSVEEASASAELQFQTVLAELRRGSLSS